jgi:hypothetical protein
MGEKTMSESTELAEKLKSEGERFVKYFSELTDAQWGTEVYTEGEMWTLRNVLSHFVTSERGLVKMFKLICEGGTGATEDFSIDRYNTSQQAKTQYLTTAELLTQYQQVRADTVIWVSGLTDEDLERKGRHPYLGETILREMVKMLYIHNQVHYRDVKKVLKS